LAETREQARRDVSHGIVEFNHYFRHVVPGGMWSGETAEELLAENDIKRTAIIGTPDDAVERLQELEEASGGFGTFLIMTSDWATPDATRRSLELFAQHVMPKFDGRADAAVRSWQWVDGARDEFAATNWSAIQKAGFIGADRVATPAPSSHA
jgi:limonene 1,2-monooxygenase